MKRGAGIALAIVISFLLVGILNIGGMDRGSVNAFPTGNILFVDSTWTPDRENDKYNSIQDAINNASSGDIIYVFDGTYEENLFIGESLQIVGENNVILSGIENHNAIHVMADGVTISNFTVMNGAVSGILINGSLGGHNVTVKNCIITGNGKEGVLLDNTYGNSFINCSIYGNPVGIREENSYENAISDSEIYGGDDGDWGIIMEKCNSCTISDTSIYGVENKTIKVNSSQYIYMYNLTLYDAFCGIWFLNTTDSFIIGCNISENTVGMMLENSDFNKIKNCKFENNFGYGIYSENSFFNLIHHNNFIGNGINAYDLGYNYWNSSIGNYWDDYTGSDGNGDGIGELPYCIGDYRPLIYPIELKPSFVWIDDDYTIDTPGWGIDHFSDLQEAIDSLRENGSCYVYVGDYHGCNLYKPLTLIGEEGATIQSNNDGLFITANDVQVKGFYIEADKNGINIQNAENVVIKDCYVHESTFGLYAVNAFSCNVLDSSFYYNVKGIYLFNSSELLISHNRIYNNSYFGVEISHSSSDNQISDCQIENNSNYGIYITQNSNGNKIYHNNFIGNTAYDTCNNEWNSSYEYVLGNYWGDYNGNDSYHGKNLDILGKDGIGDTPYYIDGGSEMDAYPLMQEIMLFPKELTLEELDNKWALICVSTNDLDFDNWDQYQLNYTGKQPVNGFAWQKFIPDCDFIYYITFLLETPAGAGPVNISIRTSPNDSLTSIFNYTWQPDAGFYEWTLPININITPGNPYYFVIECSPMDQYNMSGAVAPVYTNGGESNLNTSIPGWNWYFMVYGRFSNTDGFPAQGLQAYYTLKAHGYRDDHIIFMLWHDNDTNVSIYGTHNDLLGSPPEIGGPDEPPEIDYSHNTPLNGSVVPAGITDWYDLLEYNIDWLANNVEPDDDIMIYLVNHGGFNNSTGKGVFCFEDGSPDLPEDIFDSWIDSINCRRLTLLVDTCYSGDFIDAPDDPGFDSGIDDETNRILISASGHRPGWYYTSSGGGNWAGSLFFHPFFEQINKGESLKKVYEYACSYIPSQNPQIVDNIGDSNKYNFVKRLLPNFVWVNQIFNSSFPGWDLDHLISIDNGVRGVVDGGGCFVFTGVFEENVEIDKDLYLSGMQKNQTIVGGDGMTAFTVTGNGVEIHNLGIRNCWNDAGVNIIGNDAGIFDCDIYDNYYGIYIHATNTSVERSSIHGNSFTGVMADNMQHSEIKNCSIYKNNNGIVLSYSTYNVIEKNDISGNSMHGLRLQDFSTHNTLSYNVFENNIYGVYAKESSSNDIYLNNFIGNTMHAYDSGRDNNWDNGRIGNYWSDYNGTDLTGPGGTPDGIGDTPYVIPGGINVDRYPLIRLAGLPVAYFTYIPSGGIDTETEISFIDMSVDLDGSIVSWTWDFGDGNTSFLENPFHSYGDDGTYNVTLEIMDDDGNNGTAEAEIYVANVPPVANFTWVPPEPTDIDTVNFMDTSVDPDGSVVNRTWDFGDGSTGYGENVMHEYESNGTYAVTLTVTDDDGGVGTIQKYVDVWNVPPYANFSYSPISPSTSDMIQFNDTSVDPDGSVVNRTWDFGDGSIGYGKNAVHSYADDGTYAVMLIVRDNDNGTSNITKYVNVSNVAPLPDFSFSPSSPRDVDVIHFTDASYDTDGSVVAWLWDFGDGHNSTLQNPTHIYSDDGIYTVKLTATDDDGSSASVSKDIKVRNAPPTADFYYVPPSPDDMDNVSFYDSSGDADGSVVAWHWNFGDGNISSEQNPSHAYSDNGVYAVRLTVTDDDGSNDTVIHSIIVANIPPVASFTYAPANITDTDDVVFTDNSSDSDGSIVNWTWDFGDGNISYGQNATHKYADDGTYTVKLTVTDNDGSSSSSTKEIVVLNVKPVAEFSYTPEKPQEGKYVSFQNLSSDADGVVVNATWDFGDGFIERDGKLLSHKYDKKGVYEVTLTVTDDDGASSSVTKTIVVKAKEETSGFDFVMLVAAVGILLFMWRSKKGIWRMR